MNESDLILAERETENTLQTGLSRIKAQLTPSGRSHCIEPDCSEPIGAARLAAVPSAVRCSECAELHEKRGKQYAPR